MFRRLLSLTILLPCIAVFGQLKLGDLNGDEHSDLLFRDADGIFACSVDPSQNDLLSNHLSTGFQTEAKWHVAVLAHLDADGKTDLLLRHPDGMWEYVPMDGCEPREADRSGITALTERNSRIVLAADIDGDDRDELFWRNDEGQWTIRFMDGANVRQTIHDPTGIRASTAWYTIGSGDLDSDGIVDLVFRHRDGSWMRHWTTQVGEITFSSESLPFERDPSWREEAIADFDGDGKDDLLLRHANGHWKVQSLALDGAEQLQEWNVRTLPSSWDWRVAGFGDINGNGNADLLMRGPQNQWSVSPVRDSGMESDGLQIGRDPDDTWRIPTPPVYIPDATLKEVIKTELGKSDNEWIFSTDMRRVTELSHEAHDGQTEPAKITDLRGLRYANRLRNLTFSNHEVENLSPLIGLDQLSWLTLKYNRIQNISPLVGLSKISNLNLTGNQINSLEGIESLVSLRTLLLGNNEIRDISPLADLTKLLTLNLGSNKISNLDSISNLTSLTSLSLHDNEISNIEPIQVLKELHFLNLGENNVESIAGISALKKLTSLHLFNNQISDISELGGLANLSTLDLGSNQITDIEVIGSLNMLANLNLWNNQISDISNLSSLSNIRILNLALNRIVDISSISELTELTHLYLFGNQISDISPLQELGNLVVLILSSNEISEIDSLAKLTKLEELKIEFNPLSDSAISVLEILASEGISIEATITRGYTDSKGTSSTFAFQFGATSNESTGVLVFFHGNNTGTQRNMIKSFLPSTTALARRHGLVGIVISSPEGGSATLPWSVPHNIGDSVRFFNYAEDVDFVHELLQSGFGGFIDVDLSQVYLHGGSQGTCFLNRFVSKWGKHYGGGLLANCGCSEGLDPLLHVGPSRVDQFRVFVRATTGDFLHNLSRQAYGYYKYVVGFDTWGDLNTDGQHCSRSDISDDDALAWLRTGNGKNESVSEAHVTRVSLFDRIVGLATDMHGAVWIVQQLLGAEPQATLWRSVDRGDSFEFIASLKHEIYDLDIVDDRLFLTTPDSPILRSEDSGRTFSPIDLNSSIANGLISHPAGNAAVGRIHSSETPVLVSTHGGSLLVLPREPYDPRIYVSTNFGNSWIQRAAPQVFRRAIYPDPVNLLADDWYVSYGRPPTWLIENNRFIWRSINSPSDADGIYPLRSTAWSGTELLGFTYGYGSLWSSTDLGNRWDRKRMPKSAEISFGSVSSADLSALPNGDVLLVGGGRDAQIYNGYTGEWNHIYGAGGIGLTPGYIHLTQKVALDPIRGDVYITDSRGLFRIDARFRPNEDGVPRYDDLDEDSIPDLLDSFPNDPSEYLDTDSDGVGNTVDVDDDGDGTDDVLDASPLDPLETQDYDRDGVGDRHDNDKDGDKVVDVLDHFPLDFKEFLDSDLDGVGNWEDQDDDNDGVEDRVDAFPLYEFESTDSDGDFIGDNIDPDPNESTFTSDDHLSPAIGSWVGTPARSISMKLTKPIGLNAPEIVGGTSLYGTLTLGSAGVTSRQLMLVILDGTEKPVLYIDRNGDNNLANDGPALHLIRVENFLFERWYRSWVEVSYQTGITLPYYLYVSVRLNENGESAELSFGANGRVLTMTVSGDDVMNLVVVDTDGDGLFNGSDDIYCVDLNLDRRFTDCNSDDEDASNEEQFQIGESFTYGDTVYTPRISPSGYTIAFETVEHTNSSVQSNEQRLRGSVQTSHPSTFLELSAITAESFYDPLLQN